MRRTIGRLVLALGVAGSGYVQQVLAQETSESRSLSFEDCLVAQQRTIVSLDVSPRDIMPVVNTGTIRITRICTADGSVLISCNKPEQRMAITKSPHGEDVGCRK